MRKVSLVAAIALMLAGVGVWATSTIQARIAAPAGAQIDPLQKGARHLPPVADRVVTDDAPETEPWGPFRTTDW